MKARQELVELKRRLADLERDVAGLKKTVANHSMLAGDPSDPPPTIRFTSRGVRAQRDRLGMSAEDFGKLLGVSSQAIYNWEHGTARPRPILLEKLAVLRSVGKREARARVRTLDGNGK